MAGHKMLSCGGEEATISAMIGVIHGRVSSPQISTLTHLLIPKIPPSVIYVLDLKFSLSFKKKKKSPIEIQAPLKEAARSHIRKSG